MKRVYGYALACGKATRDASSGLGRALAPVVSKPRSAVTNPQKFGAMLRAIDLYAGQPATIAALKLLPLLFTRPGELRLATSGRVRSRSEASAMGHPRCQDQDAS